MEVRDWNLRLGAILVGGLALVGAAADWLSPYDPRAISLAEELQKPSLRHWLGCDANGTDILSILLHGARISLAWDHGALQVGFSLGVSGTPRTNSSRGTRRSASTTLGVDASPRSR